MNFFTLPALFTALVLFTPLQSFHDFRRKESERQAVAIKSEQADIIAKGASPVLISREFKFTEGPAADKQGNVYFTDRPNNRIMKYDVEGQLTVFMKEAGRANGTYFDRRGNLVACADEKNEIWSITMDKKVTVLLKDYEGKKLNGPNDLWIDKEGGVFFTDPYYQRDYWTRSKSELDGQKVYYLPKGKTQALVVEDKVKQPNGIVGSFHGKTLYVADVGDHKIYKYTIGKDGKLLDKLLFVNEGSDGMTLDTRGNLYLTGKGVTVYNPDGEKIEHIEIPERTTNVCFGGKNKDVLFITATEAFYKLQMNVKGDY